MSIKNRLRHPDPDSWFPSISFPFAIIFIAYGISILFHHFINSEDERENNTKQVKKVHFEIKGVVDFYFKESNDSSSENFIAIMFKIKNNDQFYVVSSSTRLSEQEQRYNNIKKFEKVYRKADYFKMLYEEDRRIYHYDILFPSLKDAHIANKYLKTAKFIKIKKLETKEKVFIDDIKESYFTVRLLNKIIAICFMVFLIVSGSAWLIYTFFYFKKKYS